MTELDGEKQQWTKAIVKWEKREWGDWAQVSHVICKRHKRFTKMHFGNFTVNAVIRKALRTRFIARWLKMNISDILAYKHSQKLYSKLTSSCNSLQHQISDKYQLSCYLNESLLAHLSERFLALVWKCFTSGMTSVLSLSVKLTSAKNFVATIAKASSGHG